MGLGKTVQAIAFISELVYTHKISRPFLVAVPLSTINNWKREFEFWLPEVNVLMYHGKGASRKIARELMFYHNNLSAGNGQELFIPKFNVLLTSYESLFRDFFELAKIEWQAFFIDEGQKLKNNNSKLFKKC